MARRSYIFVRLGGGKSPKVARYFYAFMTISYLLTTFLTNVNPPCTNMRSSNGRPSGDGSVGNEQSDDDPIDSTGCLSSVLVTWLSKAIYKARKEINYEDLPTLSKFDLVSITGARLRQLYFEAEKKQTKTPQARKVVFRFCQTRFLISFALCALSLMTGSVGPAFMVNALVNFTSEKTPSFVYGIGLCFALLGVDLFRSLTFGSSWMINIRTSIRLRSSLSSLLYSKLIRLKGLQDKSMGEVINILVNDLQRVFEMFLYLNFFCSAPFGVAAGMVYAGFVIGWTAVVGLLCYLLVVPMQVAIMKLGYRCRAKAIVFTDRRVRVIHEILTCIKLIKFYAWEQNFEKSVACLREQEAVFLRQSATLHNITSGVNQVTPTLVSVITLLVHTALGYSLTAAQAFTTIAIFSSMRLSIGALALPMKAIAEALVGFERIDSLLTMEEKAVEKVSPPSENDAVVLKTLTVAVSDVKGASVDKDCNSSSHANRSEKVEGEFVVLTNINMKIKKGRLVGICGPVGCGKTSLLSAILGELQVQEGTVDVNGKLAYVPQQAWIFHDTVRENILFGEDWNKAKYNRIINACSLRDDMRVWSSRDLTEVGERGINLSGGQKQRISLARAAYSDRDIVLLDDPLSAVDAHVGKHIFFECIKKQLAGKTILFVTHQLQYLKDCDEVIMLKNGRVIEETKDKILRILENEKIEKKRNRFSSKDAEERMSDEQHADVFNEDHGDVLLETREKTKTSMRKTKRSHDRRSTLGSLAEENVMTMMMDENQEFGKICWKTYKAYINAAGGCFVISFLFFLIFAFVFTINLTTFWMTYWIKEGGQLSCSNVSSTSTANYNVTGRSICRKDPNIVTNTSTYLYQFIYASILLGSLVFLFLRSLVYPPVSVRASSFLHEECLKTVLKCPMTFFDCTPIGRLLNRFSNDVDEVDGRLPFVQNAFLQQFFVMVISLGTICFVFPLFLVVVVALCTLFVTYFILFRDGSREFKRFENVCRSPWISHITATTSGLSSIHAYKKSNNFMKKFENLVDVHTRTLQAYYFAQFWIAQRLDCFTITINFLVAILSVVAVAQPALFGIAKGSAVVGLALTYAIQMTGMLQLFVRYAIEAESLYTSVERLQEYVDCCSSEGDSVPADNRPPENWPAGGKISFEGVSMKYREGLPDVLRNVSFSIDSKEKIGIVGRTGSGKSSIGVVLFRLVELYRGKILIDDVDIANIGLEDLRKKLTIIPQDPVLFAGSVRYNLDPFRQRADDEIWKALERCHVKRLISELPNKLDSEVVENGENFSVGERQLLCMARAILRHSRIIMLDEATAAIDSETDSLVQDTIREAFANCTMLTIAHRLNTVLTCDKILVMDEGKVVEFDTPEALINNPMSEFSQLLSSSTYGGNKENTK